MRQAALPGLLFLLVCGGPASQVAAGSPGDVAQAQAVDREAEGAQPGSGPEAPASDEVEPS